MSENVNVQNNKNYQGISQKEYSLIQELVKERLENHEEELEYESFDGYEIPPRTQFSMTKKPAVSIKRNQMYFNTASLHLFEGVQYVIPMFNRKKQRFAIIPCSEEESASIEWARKKDGKWMSKSVVSPDFINIIFREMGWDKACRYKVLGNLCLSPQGMILVFDLSEAIMFAPQQEYADPESGKKKKLSMKFYADKYRDQIGISYSDYEASKKLNEIDDLEEYNDINSQEGNPSEEITKDPEEEIRLSSPEEVEQDLQIEAVSSSPEEPLVSEKQEEPVADEMLQTS